jgi:hypothetical protein
MDQDTVEKIVLNPAGSRGKLLLHNNPAADFAYATARLCLIEQAL